jgi:hypothetical protein
MLLTTIKKGWCKMKFEELKRSIQVDKESGDFTLQAIIDRHISAIESLKDEGFILKRLNTTLELNLAESHFKNLLFRARKKNLSKAENLLIEEENISTKLSTTKPKKQQETESQNTDSKQSQKSKSVSEKKVQKWFFETGKKLSFELIERLENNNIDCDQLNELGLRNITQIIGHLNELEISFKYK